MHESGHMYCRGSISGHSSGGIPIFSKCTSIIGFSFEVICRIERNYSSGVICSIGKYWMDPMIFSKLALL